VTQPKKRAVISFLWPAQQHVLQELCRREPGLVVVGHGRVVPDVEFASFVSWFARVPADLTHTRTEAQRAGLVSTFTEACGGALGESPAALIPWEIVSESLTLRAALDAVCVDYDVALVVLSEDLTPVGRTVADWANRRGVPCVHVLHGIPLLSPYTVHARPVAQTFVVFGERCVEAYEDVGADDLEFHVLGNPAWDALPTVRGQRASLAQQTRAKYGIGESARLIVFATTWDASQTAFADPAIHRNTLVPVLRAYQQLLAAGVDVELVVKDRVNADIEAEKRQFRALVESLGMADCKIVHAYDNGLHFLAAADVIVAVNSNMLVEAMHLGVPAINLLNDMGLMMGPSFDEQSGVIEVDDETLPAALQLVLTQPGVAEQMAQRHLQRVAHYNVGAHDGGSTRRVAKLLQQKMTPRPPTRGAWQDLDEPRREDELVRSGLVGMLSGTPRVVLDVGCGRGGAGALVRERFEGCRVVGVEEDAVLAAQAQARLQQVLVGSLGAVDLGAAGVVPGSLDAVLFVDVLARLADPWRALLQVRALLATDGDVVLSVPNVRNLLTIGGLLGGAWAYEEQGTPGIRHLRFFTRRDVATMAQQTGYRIVQEELVFDPRLQPIFEAATSFPTEVNGDRFTLKDIDREELAELCAATLYFRLRKAEGSTS
jgi:SAM-dependent methyltransferase